MLVPREPSMSDTALFSSLRGRIAALAAKLGVVKCTSWLADELTDLQSRLEWEAVG